MPHPAVRRYRQLTEDERSRLIEMAWEDRTPFEAIEAQFGLSEDDTVAVMRHALKAASFRRWRQRMQGRSTKHRALRAQGMTRAYCPTQYKPR